MATTTKIYTRTEKGSPTPPEGHEFQPLSQNAYRVLGLSCVATQGEVYEAAARLRRTLKLGVAKTFAGDLAWLGGHVSREETDIRDAVSRLSNPPQRIYERLFWFADDAHAAHHAPVSNLKELHAAANSLLAQETRASRHDAALLSLATLLRRDAEMKIEAAWARAFSLWRDVIESDEYWSFLIASELKGDFEQLATYAEARELRGRTLRVVTAPVAAEAKDALAREDLRVCGRALSILRGASLPEKLWAEYENDILAPVEDQIEETCQSVFAWARWASQHQSKLTDRIETYGKALGDYDQRLRPLLKKIFDVAGAQSHCARRGFESAATHLNELATFYKDIGDTDLASKISQAAWKLAPPESATLRLIEEGMSADDLAQMPADKTDDGYARVLASELTPTTMYGQTDVFRQFTERQQQKTKTTTNKGAGTSLVWVVFGLLICVLLSRCENSGSRSRTHYGTYPGTVNFNYNVAIPQFTPFPVPQFSPLPHLEPLTIPAPRRVSPPPHHSTTHPTPPFSSPTPSLPQQPPHSEQENRRP